MGLYSNIHAKKKRIAAGSGETMRSKGDKGAPTEKNFEDAAKTRQMKSGGREVLKNIPKNNKGLPKLPKNVRNNMGYYGAGGPVNTIVSNGSGAVLKSKIKTTKIYS
tara:strand:+ start:278 stop:598 length:321 start_codon:yes stop_codon:yes gene_type:complete